MENVYTSLSIRIRIEVFKYHLKYYDKSTQYLGWSIKTLRAAKSKRSMFLRMKCSKRVPFYTVRSNTYVLFIYACTIVQYTIG